MAASFLDVNVVYLIQPEHKTFFEDALDIKFESKSALHQVWKNKGED